ncbi:MAG: hypothetical protein JSR83_05675 [Proteobacteria bacterium]|nr:hypothetical protein [Pseudomonadota bacterium]
MCCSARRTRTGNVFLGLARIVQETAGNQHRQMRFCVVAGEGSGTFGDLDGVPEITVTAIVVSYRRSRLGSGILSARASLP